MKRNLGSFDRYFRLALGLAVVVAGLYYQHWFGLLGLVFIGTALVNWCPIYAVLGINTCSLPKRSVKG